MALVCFLATCLHLAAQACQLQLIQLQPLDLTVNHARCAVHLQTRV